jgi:hypothetical protein
MQKILFIFSLLSISYGYSQNTHSNKIVKNQLKDFKIFKESFTANSAGLYFYISEKEFESSINTLEKTLSTPLSDIEIYKAYSKCVASIHCGHSIIMVKKIHEKYLKNNSSFPFEVYYINGKLLVKNAYEDQNVELKKYTEIKSINGEKIADLISYFSLYISSDGNNQTHKNELMKNEFMFYYYCFKNQPKTLDIEYYNSKNEVEIASFNATIPSYVKQQKESDYFCQLSRFIDTTNKRATLILPNPLPRNNTYKLQLDTFFVLIQQYKIDDLIIDVRGNTGGLTQNYLTGFFCDSSYTFESRTLKANRKLNYHYQKPFDSQRLSILCTRIVTKNGRKSTVKESVPNSPQFKGNLYMLTDGWTFSAASNLTSILKEHSNAIIIGEETGGSYHKCSTGNLILKLPKSKLSFKINPMQYENSVFVSEHKGGVLPTYDVKPSDKWDSTEDLQLQFVYELIKKQKTDLKR